MKQWTTFPFDKSVKSALGICGVLTTMPSSKVKKVLNKFRVLTEAKSILLGM